MIASNGETYELPGAFHTSNSTARGVGLENTCGVGICLVAEALAAYDLFIHRLKYILRSTLRPNILRCPTIYLFRDLAF